MDDSTAFERAKTMNDITPPKDWVPQNYRNSPNGAESAFIEPVIDEDVIDDPPVGGYPAPTVEATGDPVKAAEFFNAPGPTYEIQDLEDSNYSQTIKNLVTEQAEADKEAGFDRPVEEVYYEPTVKGALEDEVLKYEDLIAIVEPEPTDSLLNDAEPENKVDYSILDRILGRKTDPEPIEDETDQESHNIVEPVVAIETEPVGAETPIEVATPEVVAEVQTLDTQTELDKIAELTDIERMGIRAQVYQDKFGNPNPTLMDVGIERLNNRLKELK